MPGSITALIIVGCIILFFVFVFTVHAFITLDISETTALSVRVLFLRFKILPKKEKSYNVKNYSLKKIRKREEKARKKAEAAALKKKKKAEKKATEKAKKKAELEGLTREERRAAKALQKASKPALGDLVSLICRVLGVFCSRFFGKIRIKVARLNVRVGAADAMQTAVLYGVANQSVQYLMAGLGRITNLDGLDKAEVSVTPDFLSGKIDFDLKLTIRVSLGNVLGALIRAGWKFLVGYIRIKPDPKKPQEGRIPKAPKPPKPPRPATVPLPDKRA